MAWATIYATYHRFSGSWAFIGHRVSGLALTGYLFMHIFSLRGLQERLPPGVPLEEHPWTAYVAPYASGAWLVLEWVLFSAVLFHALNGARIALVDFGHASRYHKPLFWACVAAGVALFLAMGALMFRQALFGG